MAMHTSMGRTGTTIMTDLPERALLRLLTWLSPAFPVGAFSYSHGLERAIEEGLVGDRASLVGWLGELLQRGSAWNDAVLLAESWREALAGDCGGTAELAEALAGSRERHMETMLQGDAFRQALTAWARPGESGLNSRLGPSPSALRADTSPPEGGEDESGARRPSFPPGTGGEVSCPRVRPLAGPRTGSAWRRGGRHGRAGSPGKSNAAELGLPYPVAVGAAAAAGGIVLEPALVAYLHAFVSNLVQAAVRLVPLGQSDGVAALAALEGTILGTAARASASTLDDLGSAAFMSEIMAMRHETQYSRVFRS
jgi:urease accessory protein